jgi:beta-glucosidase-like glycosyl hydrolase
VPEFPFPLIVPAIRLDHDAARESRLAIERAKKPWTAGFCLFGGEAEEVRALLSRVREAADRPLFVASDMERGAGQQVRGLRVLPEAGVWGLAATPEEVEEFGESTAREARSVGVDVLFAPVLDVVSEPRNPIVGNRAFGWDPARVAAMGAAFVRGALRGGAAPVAKHYPGHGATLHDSHDALPVVREPLARLLDRDLAPFVHVVRDAGCPAVMTAHVAYPAMDPRGVVATFSPAIVERLRSALDDPAEVAVFTDALLMTGAQQGDGEGGAARRSLEAGCDLLLYPDDPEAVAAALAAGDADLRARAATALERVRVLLGRIAVAGAGAPAAPPVGDGAETTSMRVARRALALAGAGNLAPERDWVVVLDDDDVPDRGRVLSEMGRAARVPVGVVRLPRGERAPESAPVRGGWTVVVLSSIRAWKGTAGPSAACRAQVAQLEESARVEGRRLTLVWCGTAPAGGLHVPGTGPDVERALGEVLFGPSPGANASSR